MVDVDKLTFQVTKDDFKGYSLVLAFPSTGLVGVIAARHMIDKLEMKSVGFISSKAFAPVVLIQDGILQQPVRVYVSEKHKIAVITSEQVLHDPTSLHVFASQLGDWICSQNFKNLFSISGILVPSGKPGEPKVYGVSANEAGKKLLGKHDIEVLKEGISTGIAPLLLMSCYKQETPAIQLLGEIAFNKDYAAAAAVINKIDDFLGLELDVSSLEKEAEKMKKNLKGDLKKLQEAQQALKNKGGSSEDQNLMFG